MFWIILGIRNLNSLRLIKPFGPVKRILTKRNGEVKLKRETE